MSQCARPVRHVLLVLLAVAALTGFFAPEARSGWLFTGGPAKVEPVNGQFVFKAADFADGKARHYVHAVDGKAIRFFLVQAKDGEIRAAFDACDVCFHADKGYQQEGDFMICQNCGMKFHVSRINLVSGGCNPSPLTRTRVGDEIRIALTDLAGGAQYFPN